MSLFRPQAVEGGGRGLSPGKRRDSAGRLAGGGGVAEVDLSLQPAVGAQGTTLRTLVHTPERNAG